MDAKKYTKQFILPPVRCMDWAEKTMVEKAPVWCSVDLRDGNQALVEPMSLETKVEFFNLLVEIGFKEIEVGFPAASETEYDFLRALIERGLIPDDVTIQVLTQAREHIIKKTFEAIRGAKNVIVHVYNSTSVAQREQVFRKSREEIRKIAVDGARLLRDLTEQAGADYRFEYSPESFTGTEPEYALEVCNAVLDVWQPSADRKAIINLPATVENAMPHVYAQQIEYLHKNLKYRENVVLSLHPHNDRGSGVASAEFGLLAGADRVEGTLYAGELVFAAFSGSHQDAIAKGMRFREETHRTVWDVPYLPIDPKDVGREYDSDVIRINSQSGKGGVGYILEHAYGLKLPARMKEAVSYAVKHESDVLHKELKAEEIFGVFGKRFLSPRSVFSLGEVHYRQENGITATVQVVEGEKKTVVEATGNGRLDAVSNALKKHFGVQFNLTGYEQHALSSGSFAQAISYLGVETKERIYWGAGENSDITLASVQALVSALNNLLSA